MLDENADAKQQAEQSSSSEVIDKNDSTSTQESEKLSVDSKSNGDAPFHEHPRFKELIEERNREKIEKELYKREVETLRQQNVGSNEVSKQRNIFDNAVDELVGLGMERNNAMRFVQQQTAISQAVASQYITPVAQNVQNYQLNQAVTTFSREHKDYDQLKNKMSDILASLPEKAKNLVLEDISGGLDYLYNRAKDAQIKDIEKTSLEKGRQEAYEKKQEKSSLSSSKSSVTDRKVSLDSLKDMDMEDYAKKKKEYDRLEAELLGVSYRGK